MLILIPTTMGNHSFYNYIFSIYRDGKPFFYNDDLDVYLDLVFTARDILYIWFFLQ